MDHPKRYMADGMATTRRTHDVVSVECDNPYHVACFTPVMSWAGDPIPRENRDWHLWLNRSGQVEIMGPVADRESAQFLEGLRRRVRNKVKA